jgi:deoxyribodipyrimidine photolyase
MLATSRVKRGRHRFRLERRLIAVTSVVWLKRDLRVADHRPLTAAAARGRVVVLFVYEPELIAEQTTDPSHYTFIDECLIELEAALGARGGALTYRYGPMPDVLATLSDELGGFDALYAHEETGSAVSYARDKRVRAWCAARGIACYEIPQFGVIRPLRTRDGWARRWDARMTEPLVAAPSRIETPALAHGARRTLRDIGLPERHKPEAKRGGESRALAELESFLATRGVNYRQDMSSPVAGWSGCSRLSPYIAFGAISLRTVYRATLARAANVRERRLAGEPLDARWTGSLSSFRGRLHWHCHFMQKLEDQPSLEFVNATRAFDGMREDDFDETRFAAWCAGRTGYPMVDACMRALHAGGWINFRMRAMLMSFRVVSSVAALAPHGHLSRDAVSRFRARHSLAAKPDAKRRHGHQRDSDLFPGETSPRQRSDRCLHSPLRAGTGERAGRLSRGAASAAAARCGRRRVRRRRRLSDADRGREACGRSSERERLRRASPLCDADRSAERLS